MQKVFLCLIMLAGATLSVSATNLYLRSKSAPDQTIDLGEIRNITFGEQAITIGLATGMSIETSLDDFVSLRANGGTSGINDVFIGCDGGSEWKIYDINGVFCGWAESLGKGALCPGVYIFKSNNKTVKAVVQ